jgi:uncharacterized hydrophobic protein (TIGR00271 family)
MLRMLRRLALRKLPEEEAQAVRREVDADGRLSERYVLMCMLSAGIATLGLLQSSAAVVIGAMLISPLMSPIAKLGFSFAGFDAKRAQEAAFVLGMGALAGILIGLLLTWLSPIRNATPEILARTAPTLLDLVVAVLSGLAGGYATVHRRGETAIGVAIATALMPPLATVGYSLGVARLDFAAGAGLLFLTNLAAIAFSFALVARLRGVARPLERVEFKPVHVALATGAFLALATPLALTLRQVTLESRASGAARAEISRAFGVDPNKVVQLAVSWSNLDIPHVTATVITPVFNAEAEDQIAAALATSLRSAIDLQLEQIVAADSVAETQAVVEAAVASARQAAAPSWPSTEAVVRASRLLTMGAWADPERQVIMVLAAPQPADLVAMRLEEQRLNALGFAWPIQLLPPFRPRLPVLFASDAANLEAADAVQLEAAIWALTRWRVTEVVVEGFAGRGAGAASEGLALQRAQAVADALAGHGVSAAPQLGSPASAAIFASEGDARLHSGDIVPFPILESAP